MAAQTIIRISLPGDLNHLRFPKALDRRLQQLLDKQSIQGKLAATERREAEGLVEMAQIISLLRGRAERKSPSGKRS